MYTKKNKNRGQKIVLLFLFKPINVEKRENYRNCDFAQGEDEQILGC